MEREEIYRGFLKSDRWEEWRGLKTDQRKGVPAPPVQKPYPEDAALTELVPLEELTVGQMPVLEAIKRRRSRRSFSDEPLTLEELSFLLWATQGIDAGAEWSVQRRRAEYALRTVPSGGARHPFETYLVVNRVNSVAPGLYRYLPVEHSLTCLRAHSELAAQIASAFSTWIRDSAVVFIWSVLPYRTEWRYSVVSPKLIAQDSGHLCQNLYLACEAIGAGTCAVGAYDQGAVDALLGVDGQEEFAIYLAPVGRIG
jgi:SagB-type dehydrogenase family enzyme